MFRKIFILAISLLFAVTFIGCSSSKTSQPEQIDVIELPLHDAYSKLNKEGWSVTTADDTLYSGYIPGSYENGDTSYTDKAVTRVEFHPSQLVSQDYATVPTCTVYFESDDETLLIDNYDFDYAFFHSCYKEFSTKLIEQGATEELLSNIITEFNDLLAYDSDKIPSSRQNKHRQLVQDYATLLGLQINETAPSNSVNWVDAHQYIGKTVSIYGEVKGFLIKARAMENLLI